MTLAIPNHPQRWRRAVTPRDVGSDGLALVAGGAIVPGARADALVAIDQTEAMRRSAVGLRSVESVPLLDVLLGLPIDYPVAVADLSARERRLLNGAPAGCVEFSSTTRAGDIVPTVTRTLRAPLTVVAAVGRDARWRAAIRRIANFYPLAQRVVILPGPPDAASLVEAQVAGVGVWVEYANGVEERLSPEPFAPKYIKAVSWQFAEDAYRRAAEHGIVRGGEVEAGRSVLRHEPA